MLQNAVQFAAKRKAKCCKMRADKRKYPPQWHKYPPQWHKQTLLEPLKTWHKRAKQPLNSGILGAKSGYLELKIYELATKLERQNGAKRRF